jgi:hypothetical protein
MPSPTVEAGSLPVSRVRRLMRRTGIDRAVGFTVLGRGWNALSGLVTLLLMARCLSPVQQGYYVTFGSVLAMAVFFELGISLVLIQFASHERAGLQWTAAGTLEGEPTAKSRLTSLLRMSLKWYAMISAGFVVIVLPLGLAFFGRHSHTGVVWQMPWVWIILITGVWLALIPLLAILEGCGLIAEIARLQMWLNIVGSLLLWTALLRHWGLFAAPVTNTVNVVGPLLWLGFRKRAFLLDLLRMPVNGAQVDWRREFWPLQWKVALSCVSGFFVFQLFNPVLFATHGAVAAGQMGLSLAVMGAVGAVSIAWMTTKAAVFGTLIAQKEFARLDRLFFPCLWQSWTLVTIGSAAVWGLEEALRIAHVPLSSRFLPPLPLGLLVGVTIISHGIFAEAIYLRAHKQEPFLVNSVVTAALMALSILLLSRPYGATGMLLGYFLIVLLGLISSTRIFQQKRREWHSAPDLN